MCAKSNQRRSHCSSLNRNVWTGIAADHRGAVSESEANTCHNAIFACVDQTDLDLDDVFVKACPLRAIGISVNSRRSVERGTIVVAVVQLVSITMVQAELVGDDSRGVVVDRVYVRLHIHRSIVAVCPSHSGLLRDAQLLSNYWLS